MRATAGNTKLFSMIILFSKSREPCTVKSWRLPPEWSRVSTGWCQGMRTAGLGSERLRRSSKRQHGWTLDSKTVTSRLWFLNKFLGETLVLLPDFSGPSHLVSWCHMGSWLSLSWTLKDADFVSLWPLLVYTEKGSRKRSLMFIRRLEGRWMSLFLLDYD